MMLHLQTSTSNKKSDQPTLIKKAWTQALAENQDDFTPLFLCRVYVCILLNLRDKRH